VAWGWIVLAYQIWYSAWYLMPYRFDWRDSLPLQLCDLAAFVAAFAMITHWRVWRTLLYFWGIGLSTQAFFTPTLQYGVGHIKFYMFWIGHTMIVGSAVYDIVIGRYRPSRRDWAEGVLITYTLCMSVFLFNVVMSDWLGYPLNYWYIGNTHPNAATIIDRVGPWPERVISVVVIVLTDFLLLWAVWPLAAFLKRCITPPAPTAARP